MKLTLEHAIIAVVTLALIYYVIQYSNLVKDVFRIPDRDHPELKAVKEKHNVRKQRGVSTCIMLPDIVCDVF